MSVTYDCSAGIRSWYAEAIRLNELAVSFPGRLEGIFEPGRPCFVLLVPGLASNVGCDGFFGKPISSPVALVGTLPLFVKGGAQAPPYVLYHTAIYCLRMSETAQSVLAVLYSFDHSIGEPTGLPAASKALKEPIPKRVLTLLS